MIKKKKKKTLDSHGMYSTLKRESFNIILITDFVVENVHNGTSSIEKQHFKSDSPIVTGTSLLERNNFKGVYIHLV